MSGKNFGFSWRQWKLIVQDPLEDKKGHGHDGSDLPFKRMALVEEDEGYDATWVGLLEHWQNLKCSPRWVLSTCAYRNENTYIEICMKREGTEMNNWSK